MGERKSASERSTMLKKMLIVIVVSTLALAMVFRPTESNDAKTPVIPEDQTLIPKMSSMSFYNSSTGVTITPKAEPIDHIEVFTTRDFQNFTANTEDGVSIPLFLKFVSPKNTSSTTISINTDSEDALNCYISLGPNKGFIRLNDFINYSTKGSILLERDKIIQLNVTIKMPSTTVTNVSPHLIPFNMYGIESSVPFKVTFGGNLLV